MNNANVWLLILGMAAVTYLPRAIPAVLVEKLHFSGRMDRFLRLIPYTAMAAMVFPGVLTTDPSRPLIGVAGGLTAALLAWRKCSPMLCVLAAVGVNFLLYLFL